MTATYRQAMAYIQGLLRFGMRPGLQRTRELLRRLGDPHRAGYRIVHIGGTNGKGTTSALVAAGLRAAGRRVGLYTSPDLERWNERIQINGQPIADADVAALVQDLRRHVEAMVAEGHEQPTEFEVTTALALWHFARAAADWVVLEAGLGVRHDTTNVVETPAVTCLTSVDLDHVEILGPTLQDIARDKAAICKPGVPCISAVADPTARSEVRRAAAAAGAPLVEVAVPPARRAGLEGQYFDLPGCRDLYLPLVGQHQLQNAACAVAILAHCGVPPAAIRRGLAAVTWPGRFELLRRDPPLILDCAHNPSAAAALAHTLAAVLPGVRPVVVLGVLAEKDAAAIAGILAPLACRLILTAPEHPRRALPAAALAQKAPPGLPVHLADRVSDALDLALAAGNAGHAVLVTGSFYLVGPARRYLRAKLHG